jgi:molybdopterin molybdotransferase
MVEHVVRQDSRVHTEVQARDGENINPAGKEAARGAVLAHPGRRLNYADIALLATVGHTAVSVYRKPTVAILATGDEVVPIDTAAPETYQVRNSNSYSVAAQVQRAGAVPVILPVAPDRYDETRRLMETGLQQDLLLLSGGVSAGKYDIVEKVLADLGAEFYFDRVKIQPGAPLVFGRASDRFFFGLPGNPASTMVTFEVLARAMLERLSGIPEPQLPLCWAKLKQPFRHKGGLRRFLPARLEDGGMLTPLGWAGSSDVAALGRANAFLIADPDTPEYAEGDWIQVLPQ